MVVQCLWHPWQLLTRVTVDSGVMLVIETRVLCEPQCGHSIRTDTTHPQSAHGEGQSSVKRLEVAAELRAEALGSQLEAL